jgi:hypothetical protein
MKEPGEGKGSKTPEKRKSYSFPRQSYSFRRRSCGFAEKSYSFLGREKLQLSCSLFAKKL